MKVTIKDVAKKVGVSPSTVSKVINKHPSISKKTIELVEAAMNELHYFPNAQARSFAKQTTNTIIFLVKTEQNIAFTNPHMFQIMCGASQYLGLKGYHIEFLGVNNIEEIPPLIEKRILQRSADGIIIHGSATTKALAELLVRLEFPHIFVGKPAFSTTACWIDINNYISGQMAGRHLLGQGFKKIAFIGESLEDEISAKRLKGFMDICKKEGITIPEYHIKCYPSQNQTPYHKALELLEHEDRPQAILCENNQIAFGAEKAITEQHLSIPKDIALMTFDNFPLSQLFTPPLTVVEIDVHDMGVQAGEALLKKIKNPLMQIQVYATSPSLIIRKSTHSASS